MSALVILSVSLLAVLGIGFGAGLAVAARRFRVEMDPRVEEVLAVLPGANCGSCGYAGCAGYAAAVVKGEAPPNACTPGGPKCARLIGAILGVSVDEVEKRRAVVHCQGGWGVAAQQFDYAGVRDCAAAALLQGGPKACKFGCVGLGNCSRACPFGAIQMSAAGLPVISEAKCTACGVCVKACPVGIISILPSQHRVFLGCSNPAAKGPAMKAMCGRGCIKCRLCVKVTESGAVSWGESLPKIDFAKWTDPDAAVTKCPMSTFVDQRGMTAAASVGNA
ncbi:MAG TPA: RnfABCDGE type electron transport complex subunit B [Planctomycetota bacterium]|nr:RnfABCDGE type electron transport complex subunit B [Planctomycetota bacterium]HRR81680.1 RnfABCDGE type electron transport complex subunit B [Planctomycetota bacterium]HRT94480.1 RnfABCDGE type electron transport complex subunit B [Planctomycetota bacterium]